MTVFSRSFIRKRVISLAATTAVMVVSFSLAKGPMQPHHGGRLIPAHYVTTRPERSAEQAFLSEHRAAMSRLMANVSVGPVLPAAASPSPRCAPSAKADAGRASATSYD
jgi:hypothetical protein